MGKTKPISVPIDSDTYDKVAKLAKLEDRSIAKQTNRLIKEALAELQDESVYKKVLAEVRQNL